MRSRHHPSCLFCDFDRSGNVGSPYSTRSRHQREIMTVYRRCETVLSVTTVYSFPRCGCCLLPISISSRTCIPHHTHIMAGRFVTSQTTHGPVDWHYVITTPADLRATAVDPNLPTMLLLHPEYSSIEAYHRKFIFRALGFEIVCLILDSALAILLRAHVPTPLRTRPQ